MELTPLAAAETLIVEDTTRARKAKAKEGAKAILNGETSFLQAAGYASSLSPDQLLRPMFVSNETSKTLTRKSDLNSWAMAKWSAQSAGAAATSASFMAIANPLAITSPFLMVATIVGVSVLTLTGFLKAIKLKNRQNSAAHLHLQRLAEQGFLQWLKSRYGIAISSKTSHKLAYLYTFGKNREFNYQSFEDSVTGQSYTLWCYHETDQLSNLIYTLKVRPKDDRYNETLTLEKRKQLEEESLLESVQQQASQITKLIPVRESLNAHNEEVFSSSRVQKILTSLALLSEHSLDIETQHIVGRIRETLNNGLTTYKRIIAFGPNPQAEQEMVTLLQTLDREVSTLVKEQVSSLVKSLTHTNIFIKDATQSNHMDSKMFDLSDDNKQTKLRKE